MLMLVTLIAKGGETSQIVVEAASGDEAAAMAFAPGYAVIGIEPAPPEPVVEAPKGKA